MSIYCRNCSRVFVSPFSVYVVLIHFEFYSRGYFLVFVFGYLYVAPNFVWISLIEPKPEISAHSPNEISVHVILLLVFSHLTSSSTLEKQQFVKHDKQLSVIVGSKNAIVFSWSFFRVFVCVGETTEWNWNHWSLFYFFFLLSIILRSVADFQNK